MAREISAFSFTGSNMKFWYEKSNKKFHFNVEGSEVVFPCQSLCSCSKEADVSNIKLFTDFISLWKTIFFNLSRKLDLISDTHNKLKHTGLMLSLVELLCTGEINDDYSYYPNNSAFVRNKRINTPVYFILSKLIESSNVKNIYSLNYASSTNITIKELLETIKISILSMISCKVFEKFKHDVDVPIKKFKESATDRKTTYNIPLSKKISVFFKNNIKKLNFIKNENNDAGEVDDNNSNNGSCIDEESLLDQPKISFQTKQDDKKFLFSTILLKPSKNIKSNLEILYRSFSDLFVILNNDNLRVSSIQTLEKFDNFRFNITSLSLNVRKCHNSHPDDNSHDIIKFFQIPNMELVFKRSIKENNEINDINCKVRDINIEIDTKYFFQLISSILIYVNVNTEATDNQQVLEQFENRVSSLKKASHYAIEKTKNQLSLLLSKEYIKNSINALSSYDLKKDRYSSCI
ncbi:MAG: hypothetical protein MHPSP_001183 [Paramarteilia canceri]